MNSVGDVLDISERVVRFVFFSVLKQHIKPLNQAGDLLGLVSRIEPLLIVIPIPILPLPPKKPRI